MSESRDITAEHARAAAQMEADVGVEHIADVYAKALLDATEQAGQTAAVIEEFDAVMADVIDRFPKLEAVFDSILVLPEEKAALIDRTLGGRVSPMLVNFLKVVARHGRLDCLRAIHCQTHVAVRQAAPPHPRAADHRHAASAPTWPRGSSTNLRGKLDGEPILEQQVDPSLIGGAVLRVGDIDLRRLDRQPIAKSSPTDERQECP